MNRLTLLPQRMLMLLRLPPRLLLLSAGLAIRHLLLALFDLFRRGEHGGEEEAGLEVLAADWK